MHYVIKSVKEAKNLPRKKNNKYNRISILHPNLDKCLVNDLEEKLNKYYFECGCKTGSSFVIVGIIISIIHFVIHAEQFSIYYILYYVITTISFAIIGKLVGLLNARIKLIRLQKEVAELYSKNT